MNDHEPATGLTTDPSDPALRIVDPDTNMQLSYLVLSEEERTQGLVRPVRTAYLHSGRPAPVNPLRPLTDDERERFADISPEYEYFEAFPSDDEAEAGGSVLGRYWSERSLSGCGTVTVMGRALAETYARNPSFYGATYCAGCQAHYPVGPDGEFTWDGTDERVGT